MVMCKYYLQGTCRFGTACKFDHNPSTGTGQSILRQHATANAAPIQQVDTATLVRSVVTDMLNCEKGGQWLFSSYAPFKEKGNFPGFEDQSCEEIRWGFYEANGTGRLEEYKRQLHAAHADAANKVRALQSPNDEAIQTIHRIYSTYPQATGIFGNPVSMFSNTSSFGAPAVNASPFGGVIHQPFAAKSTPFGSSPFASAPSNYGQPSPFAAGYSAPPAFDSQFAVAAAAAASNTRPIIQQPAQMVATTNAPAPFTGNLFATPMNAMMSQPPPPVYSTTAAAMPQPAGTFTPFASNTSIFAAPPPPSGIFATPASVPQMGSIFATPVNAPPASGVFTTPASAQPPSGIFATPTTAPPASGVFATPAPAQPPSGIFATSTPVPPTSFASQLPTYASNSPMAPRYDSLPGHHALSQQAQTRGGAHPGAINASGKSRCSVFYTPSEQLSEKDITAFRQTEFLFGLVPLIPPSRTFAH